jgi:hypothetical protein
VAQGQPEKKVYTAQRFSGGYCDGVDSFEIEDNELASCENVDIDLRGIPKVRRSQEIYTDMVNSDANGKKVMRNLHRFSNRDQVKRTFGYNADGYLVMDADDGKFNLVAGDGTDYIPSNTGFMSFAQFRDTLYASNDKSGMMAYNEDETPKLQKVEPLVAEGISFQINGESESVPAAPGLEYDKIYYYRFTFDIFRGNDFVGETTPAHWSNPGLYELYAEAWGTTRTVDSINVINLVAVGDNPSIDDLPDGAKYVNIYKTYPREIPTRYGAPINDPGFYWLGSIAVADYVAASPGDTLFVDDGTVSVDTSSPINYLSMEHLPKSRFIHVHKNRMWLGNVSVYNSDTEAYDVYPNRVYLSEHLSPEWVLNSSWLDISPANDDEITGMISWNNRILIIFKQNSVWAITGADDELAPGVPDIRLEMLDGSIGCTAPQSIAIMEGAVVWMSNRGPYYFDGSYPKPLKTDQIIRAIERIPESMRYKACGVFHTRYRAYLLSTCDSALSENPAINNTVWKFDLHNSAWTRHVKEDCGVSAWCEIKGKDDPAMLLAACEADSTRIAETGSVMKYDYRDGVDIVWDSTDFANETIPWSLKTKFFDCGRPEMYKLFDSVEIQYKSASTINVDFYVDYAFDSVSSVKTRTITPSGGEGSLIWGVGEWSHKNWGYVRETDSVVRMQIGQLGKRISVKLSGESFGERVQIQRITVFFTPKEVIK